MTILPSICPKVIALGKIKTQESAGGAALRQPIFGFSVLVHLATAIKLK
jgi:hypothetical protein